MKSQSTTKLSLVKNDEIKKARTALAITQFEMATRTGIPLSTYQRMENGRGEPSLRNLYALMRFYDTTDWNRFLDASIRD